MKSFLGNFYRHLATFSGHTVALPSAFVSDDWSRRGSRNAKKDKKDHLTCPVFMGEDLCRKVVGSNPSAVFWMDIFSYWFVVKLYCLFEMTKNIRKRDRGWPIFEKKLVRVALKSCTTTQWAVRNDPYWKGKFCTYIRTFNYVQIFDVWL